jgi:hypothetical protein
MIAAKLPDGRDVMWENGRFSTIDQNVPAALERPVKTFRSEERVEGRLVEIARVEVIVQPGTAEHARAALLSIGAVRFIDDEA